MIDNYINLITSDVGLAVKNLLRFSHFIALAVGLGGATILDIILLRFFINKSILKDKMTVFNFVSKIINASLIVIWITGIGFLIYYYFFDPIKLTNEKLYAKFTVVVILTLNGRFIEHYILPILNKNVGKNAFKEITKKQRLVFVGSAAVSVTSWYMPVAFGAFSQLNFKVDYVSLMITYFALVAVVFLSIHLVFTALMEGPREVLVRTKDLIVKPIYALKTMTSKPRPKTLSTAPKANHKGRVTAAAHRQMHPLAMFFWSRTSHVANWVLHPFHSTGPDGIRDYAHYATNPPKNGIENLAHKVIEQSEGMMENAIEVILPHEKSRGFVTI